MKRFLLIGLILTPIFLQANTEEKPLKVKVLTQEEAEKCKDCQNSCLGGTAVCDAKCKCHLSSLVW